MNRTVWRESRRAADWLMTQETYTFACPVCAVQLSVPKALAGVRGPCPQCHHEITAPDPEPVLMPAALPASVSAATGSPPSLSRSAIAGGPDPPSVLCAAQGLAADGHGDDGDEDDEYGEPESDPASEAGPPAGERDEAPEVLVPHRAPERRRSKFGLVAAVLALLGLGALAALNVLPGQSLRSLWNRIAPSDPAGAPAGEAPAPAERMINELDLENIVGTGLPTPADVTLPAAPDGTVAESLTQPIDFEPGGLNPGEDGPVVQVTGESPDASVASVAGADDASSPAPVSSEPEPVAPDQPSDDAATPVRASTGEPPSLLPDISSVTSPAPAALDESLTGAKEALTLFLHTRTWKERIMLSEGGDALRSEMENHYKQARDGHHPPTSVEHLNSAPLPGNKGVAHIFHVTFEDLPQGMPVSVIQTDDGWKVDWQAFVEFREGRLRKFFSRYQDAPATLRVRLRRVEHQDRAVPDPDQKYAFHLSVPIDGHEGFAFAGKDDSTIGPKIEDNLDPNAPPSHVMASLKWVRGISGRGYVELRDIVSDTWRPRP